MPDLNARSPSIKRHLLLFLLSSLLILVACAAALSYGVARSVATSAYDRSLLDPALNMAANIRTGSEGPQLALLSQAQEALLFDTEDTLSFQIRSPDGSVIAGTADFEAPPPMSPGEHRFYDGVYQKRPVRIASVRSTEGFVVSIGETLNKRQRLIWEIIGAALTPTLLFAGTAMVLTWTGISRGLAPLDRVRAQLLARTEGDLDPIDAKDAPIEIASALEALNRLLGKLRQANVMQQRFFANAAHQLRTPLAGLQMHLELLLRELPPSVREEVSGMHAATLRASHLANQLLLLARAEAGRGSDTELHRVDLRALADAAIHDWVTMAIARDIDLGFELGAAEVMGDRLLLHELLNNLIDNALRYTPAGGAVTVISGMRNGQPYLAVEDTGPGIPEWARSRVVERFYRVEGTGVEGSGLGLAIVKEVADRHQARLTIDASPSGGTRCTVDFPAVAARSAEATTTSAAIVADLHRGALPG